MPYQNKKILEVEQLLKKRLAKSPDVNVLRSTEMKTLAASIGTLKPEQRAAFGKELNSLRANLKKLMEEANDVKEQLAPIDVTAPFDANTSIGERPALFSSDQGSMHPLTGELEKILDIFARMGFGSVESRQLDDDYHMFGSLNFPEGHPARDEFDTFVTEQKDANGKKLVAPAHTSNMQNRVLKANKKNLKNGEPIAVVIPGRTFRNEDVDARHDHTFHQVEGVYVDKGIHAGHLMGTFKTFLEEYYGQKIEVRSQPFYFPFTEPSFEFALSCPFCQKKGCSVCSYAGWIELMGMGLIHPNVLKEAGIDPRKYTGFAWGFGLERLVMMKNNIEDIRHFHSGKLDFLRQFP